MSRDVIFSHVVQLCYDLKNYYHVKVYKSCVTFSRSCRVILLSCRITGMSCSVFYIWIGEYEVGARDGDNGLEYQDHTGPTLTVYSESGKSVLVNFVTSFTTLRFFTCADFLFVPLSHLI